MTKIGLTLGKFAPLHKGHQYLIERAIEATDRLIVVIYDAPETTTVPLTVRSEWIRRLYPQVEVLEAWDGPTEVGDSFEIRKSHEDYLLRILAGRNVTHFFSSEFYGEHVSAALGAEDCRVDESRSVFPLSGTSIRLNLYASKNDIDPIVYSDLVTKVVFLGAPSSGKTTIARTLANMFETAWMPEYGREFWELHQHDRRLTLEQLVEIAEEHVRREDAVTLAANRFLFVDTDATTTCIFSRYYHGAVHPRVAELANDTIDRYDLFFLCGDEIPYDDTWDRSGVANRSLMQKMIRADLVRRKIPFMDLKGTIDQRVRTVSETLRHFDKFDSIANQLLRRLPTSKSNDNRCKSP